MILKTYNQIQEMLIFNHPHSRFIMHTDLIKALIKPVVNKPIYFVFTT